MFKISGQIKNYAWGGKSFIPQFLAIDEPQDSYAEIWYCANPDGPARLNDGSNLYEYIKADPYTALGPDIASQYHEQLPFQLKILDVQQPMSIQISPNLQQAQNGYMREQGHVSDATPRYFKDTNHRPKMILTLSDYYLCYGLRNKNDCLEILGRFKSLVDLVFLLQAADLRELLQEIYLFDKLTLKKLIQPIIDEHLAAFNRYAISKQDPLYWLIKAYLFTQKQQRELDVGLLMLLILKLFYVPKGKVFYLNCGIIHCYLQGQNISLMTLSNNVIHAGLTNKKVDINEILSIATLEEQTESYLSALQVDAHCLEYAAPVKDLVLRHYHLTEGEALMVQIENIPCVWLIVSGELQIYGKEQYYGKGEAFYQAPGDKGIFHALTEVTLIRASARL